MGMEVVVVRIQGRGLRHESSIEPPASLPTKDQGFDIIFCSWRICRHTTKFGSLMLEAGFVLVIETNSR